MAQWASYIEISRLPYKGWIEAGKKRKLNDSFGANTVATQETLKTGGQKSEVGREIQDAKIVKLWRCISFVKEKGGNAKNSTHLQLEQWKSWHNLPVVGETEGHQRGLEGLQL